jgi:hypothetical protein
MTKVETGSDVATRSVLINDITAAFERYISETEAALARMKEALERTKMTFFYIRNLSHDAWRDPPNLVAVCKRIEEYATMEYELAEAALSGLTKEGK